MVFPQRDKLTINTIGKKKVGFYKDGEKVKEEAYPLGSEKMFDDMKEWCSSPNKTTKYLN